MNADVTSSVMDKSMSLKDADKRIKLANKFSRLITKGDEGLLELCDWIENDEISDEDAFLLLSDHLGIEL
jgi:phosphoglycerol transferase MdoB-like AlkP superfamily enzyme